MTAENREPEDHPSTVSREIFKVSVKENFGKRLHDQVVVEEQIELYINSELYVVFMTSPLQIKELAVGHLLTERIIDKTTEIEEIELSWTWIKVRLTKKAKQEPFKRPRLIHAACAGTQGKVPPEVWMKKISGKNRTLPRLSPESVLSTMATLNSQATIFKRTGGTHAAGLFDENGRMLAFSEDIGRHNAIDKVIGRAALENVDFEKTLLVSTGRLTSEMVLKVANVRVPILASLSAPTDKGIKIAETVGLTLIGFARKNRLNIYACPERILENLEA